MRHRVLGYFLFTLGFTLIIWLVVRRWVWRAFGVTINPFAVEPSYDVIGIAIRLTVGLGVSWVHMRFLQGV